VKNMSLGRLEKVGLREYWVTEDVHFTPWLAQEDNIALLGESIGIELEVEAQEKNVGPFRADILCKDTVTNNWVLIENQLERTDHLHLGQLLTYASGLNAVTIVWIADRFTEEHRAALDWLNEITDSRFNFFGLEIELWKIGESPAAPKFNIVSKPNDWSKSVSKAAGQLQEQNLTESKLLQRDYWQAFREYLFDQGSKIKPTKALPQHWMNLALGRSGFQLTAIASLYNSEKQSYDIGEIRAEMCVYDQEAKEYYSQIEQKKEEIEDAFGEPLVWYNPEDANNCRIYIKKSADVKNRETWHEQHEWLKCELEKLDCIFRPLVKKLRLNA